VLVDLALQGGGSHGAFTWGVLDRLLEVPWLKIDAISGSSAGAMNAAVLASGWISGGASGAREALDAYWERVATVAAYSPLQRTPLDRFLGRWTLDTSPAFIAFDLMARLLSPYDLNPHGFNPLEQILIASIDFDRLVRSPVKLFVTATSVRTGRGRIFRNAEITPGCCWRRPACRRCFKRSRSTASPIGTAAIPATRPSRRSCARATRGIRSLYRSIRSSAGERRARRRRS
jgi:NTE family protein